MSLHQGRYTWRHNSVLNHLATTILENKPENLEIYSEISGLDINGGTIPPDILVTTSRPDLVLVNREDRKIYLMELTCSFEQNIQAANLRKTIRYTSLKSDIEQAGYTCILIPFEIGSRGHVTKSNRANIVNTFGTNKISANPFKCIKQLSKLSLLCSYSIFHAFTQPTWRDPPLLKT